MSYYHKFEEMQSLLTPVGLRMRPGLDWFGLILEEDSIDQFLLQFRNLKYILLRNGCNPVSLLAMTKKCKQKRFLF